jgi:hypothetical protein
MIMQPAGKAKALRFATDRLTKFMRDFYKEHGTDGYISEV